MLDQKVLESFPPGSNPFHHDAISVGMTLEQIGLPDMSTSWTQASSVKASTSTTR